MQKQEVTAETKRFYGYTGKANMKWIEANAKKFGSKSKFLDALITESRKSKVKVAAPKTTITKKVKKAPKKTMTMAKKQTKA